MSEVSFGVFDWIDRGTQPLSQLYEDRLQLLAAADEAGFFCYHLAEHHATPLGMAPSPACWRPARSSSCVKSDWVRGWIARGIRITVRRSRGRGGHVSSSILRNLPAKQ